MSTLNDIRETFFQECDDLLEALDDGLQNLRDAMDDGQSEDPETINAVFRAVHSIKGGAAAFGLDALVRFAHRFETTLDDLRSHRLALSSDVIQVCSRAADQLAVLVSAGRDGIDTPPETGAMIIEKLAALSGEIKVIPASSIAVGAEEGPVFEPLALSFDLPLEESDVALRTATYHIRLTAHDKFFANGHDPVHLFREISELGVLNSGISPESIPTLDHVAANSCALEWVLTLVTSQPESEIWEVFDFVQGLCTLEIAEREGELLSPPPAPTSAPECAPVESIALSEPARLQAADKPKGDARGASGPKATVRVDLEHVDRLINVVGELVINQAVLTQCIQAAKIPPTAALSASLDEFMVLAREIQEGVMAIRAQSVKPLFQRMGRIAREAAELAGKSVRFDTEGEATEVDKTVIERLVDPLTHIIRNAVDHGLETEESRLAAGKTDPATVTLRAAHRSGRVLIDISDNGAGINRPKVLQIAMSKGLVPRDAALTDSEIDKLLFLPGFSTASAVTDLSGRGVGMDVVRSAIHKLGGRISIISAPGVGTTMSISLPLTLAVLDGMVVDVVGQTMVIPITTIVETIRPRASDIHALTGGATVVAVRDSFIPIVDLAAVFQFREKPADLTKMVYLLVESDHEQMWALAVDQIHDQRQVVIKGLENNYGHVQGIAAATILGDGKVALIIDPEEAARRTPDDESPELLPQTEDH